MKGTPEEIASKLIHRLAELRKEQGLSHEKLAEKAGLSRPAISYIENDKRVPTILTCLKICDALGVELAEVLAESKD